MLNKPLFRITSMRRFFVIYAVVIILLGLIGTTVSYIFRDDPDIGIRWGIDFTGGTVFNISVKRDATSADTDKISEIVKNITGDKPALIQITDVSAVDVSVLNSTDIIVVKTNISEAEQRKAVIKDVAEAFGLEYASTENGEVDASTLDWLLSCDTVGPAAAADLMRSAVLGITVASILMLLYISVRFDFFSGISAVVALLHDVSMMIIFTFIFGVQVNLSFVAAILTILGYSINATIIIFDRVRENNKNNRDKKGFDSIVETSVWQTMRRSVFTSLTTLFTITALYILGVPSIKEFSFPIIIGIIAGFISSVFISGNVWVTLKMKFAKK